jgi:SAM-dependent methyltransferase
MEGEDHQRVEMAAHYESGVEESRLATWGHLELLRTMEILRRYLPNDAVIGDVGGGPGAYALPLAAEGYKVHLLDPIPLHIEQAQAASLAAKDAELASAQIGDARRLPWADETIDVVLLLGPLYHLTAVEDRLKSLEEARRVLRPGGLLAAAAISRFASTYDGLGRGFLMEPEFRAIVEQDVRDGQHRNPSRHPDWFTTSYFHHPSELADEVRRGGFDNPNVLAVEGPAGWLGNLDWWLDQEDRRETLLAAIRQVEHEPTLLGASPHLLAIAHKMTDREPGKREQGAYRSSEQSG